MSSQIKAIVADIKRVAKSLKIEPAYLTLRQYLSEGGAFTEWELRKAGGFSRIIKAYLYNQPVQEIANRLDVEERVRSNLDVAYAAGSLERVLRRIEASAKHFPTYKPQPLKINKSKTTERIVTVVLSDHHIGSDIQKSETGKQFGVVEEARALACIADQVINYKTAKRDKTILHVLMLGDMIENELHGRTSADLVHIQACRALWLYPQLLSLFAQAFKEVKVFFAVGNHGRDPAFHVDRASALKFNAIETTIYFGIRQILSQYKNISFVHPLTPWVEFPLFQWKGYATHGDTHISVGNPGKSLNIARIEHQINRINASLKDTDEYKVFVTGHVHQPLITQLTNGTYLILNGALVPPNSYAQSINIMEAPQAQVLWEATPDHPVGDFRIISVSGSENDKSLDKLIKPFQGINYEQTLENA